MLLPSKHAFFLVAGLLLLGASAPPANAARIAYDFSGIFRSVPAGHPIHVGDAFHGTLFYDPDRSVITYHLEGYTHFYFFDQAGLEIHASTSTGELTFTNRPGYIEADIFDDFSYTGQPGTGIDRLFFRCGEFVNFPLFYRRPFAEMHFDLYSYDRSFLHSTDLPADLVLPPGGSYWVSIYGGANPSSLDYVMSAQITQLGPANRPPDCSAAVGRIAATGAVIGTFTPVTIDGVTDPDGDPVAITVISVTQDEPVLDTGFRPTCPDAMIENGAAQVRMERSATGNGRVYRVAFTASDGHSGSCDGAVTVCVPHDQRSDAVCVDDGTIYDSLAPCAGAPALSVARAQGLNWDLVRSAQRTWSFDFSLAEPGEVWLSIHDVAGRTIATLAHDRYTAGTHRLEWKAAGLTPGIYFARLRTNGASLVKRLAIL